MKLNLLTLSTIVFLAVQTACNNAPSKSTNEGNSKQTTESSDATSGSVSGPSSDLTSTNPSTTFAVSKTYPGFKPENIKSQHFQIDNTKEIKLTGKSGTIYIIPKRCFASSSGKIVEKPIDIEIKEAIDPIDIVMGGLYTVSNGKTLESGGMVFVDAKSEGEQLTIAPSQSIQVQVPSAQTKSDMSYFKAEKVNGNLNWINPVPLKQFASQLNEEIDPHDIEMPLEDEFINAKAPNKSLDQSDSEVDLPLENIVANAGRKNLEKGNVNLSFASIDDATEKDEAEFTKYIVDHPELWHSDSFVLFNKIRYLVKAIPIIVAPVVQNIATWKPANFKPDKPSKNNMHIADPNLTYIFQMNQLGWANIDRIYNGTNVDLRADVMNQEKFKDVYVSIIIPKQKIFIPGYMSTKKYYRFSHGDNEPQKFSIGSTAIIIATCIQDGQTYMALEKFKVSKSNKIELELKPCKKEQQEADIKTALD